MTNTPIIDSCWRCRGTGQYTILENLIEFVQVDCPECGTTGFNQVLEIDLSDITGKLNDILDKCNDIFEKVNE